MAQPQQAQQAGSSPFTAKDGTQLDPTAATLTRSIRQVESGGNYNAGGDNGTSKGAYQFNGDNFKAWAKEQGQNPDDFSPENQDKVAYTRIKGLLDKGFTQSQVASIWNHGSPNFEGVKGYNAKLGVHFDVPAYVEKVKQAYQQNLNNPQTPKFAAQHQTTTDVPTAEAADGTTAEPQKSLLEKAVNFAFPILGDVKDDLQGKSDKSFLRQAGDAGLSALWFAPGIGEAAGGAIRGAGLLGEAGANIAGHAVSGAATGYAGDVASNLSEGKSIPESLTPGLGTATGGLIGGGLGKLASKYSEKGVLNTLSKGNNSVLGQSKRGAADLAESFSKGKDPGELLASKGINLAANINPETIAYETAHHATSLRGDANTLTDTLTEALKHVAGSTPAIDLENQLTEKITSKAPDKITASEQAQIIKDEFTKIRKEYGDTLSAADLNELKKRAWNLSKFDAATPNMVRTTQRIIGNTLKTTVEDAAKKAGLEGVQEMNEYIGSHLDAADALERLHGSKAKGGRLGDLMKKHALAGVGGVSGFFGGGPIGALAGSLAGEWAGGQLAKVLRKIGASPLKTAILQRMEREDPAIVQKMLEYAKQTPQGLEGLKRQLNSKGIPLFNKMEKVKKAAPVLSPKPQTSGLIPRLITTTASRAAAQSQ